LIVLGLLAIALPVATSLGVVLVVGWLILFSGIAQLAHVVESEGIGNVIWKLLVAVFYLFAGLYLISHAALGMLGLTLALAIFFFAEGATDLITYLATRRTGNRVGCCSMVSLRLPWESLSGIGGPSVRSGYSGLSLVSAC
jgi:uncharacterized membrane protein HdeD (DUF308 family)